mgnify:CR=1 FL=1
MRRWLDTKVLPLFAERFLTIDATLAAVCANLHEPNPKPERDALIASTALVQGLTVATRNVADVTPLGVKVFNPWDFAH